VVRTQRCPCASPKIVIVSQVTLFQLIIQCNSWGQGGPPGRRKQVIMSNFGRNDC
jgi:hypothetical protein